MSTPLTMQQFPSTLNRHARRTGNNDYSVHGKLSIIKKKSQQERIAQRVIIAITTTTAL